MDIISARDVLLLHGHVGGTYYLRQSGDTLYWYGERSPENPVWYHVFSGKVRGASVSGRWTDVPKGRAKSQGNLTLRLTKGGNTLEATHKTGGFGGSKWERDTSIEQNINRSGQDIRNFDLNKANPKLPASRIADVLHGLTSTRVSRGQKQSAGSNKKFRNRVSIPVASLVSLKGRFTTSLPYEGI